MLSRLSIRDFVIVDRMDLEFAQGFTVLTGETGAGKSILIDALALLLGARAEALVVRQGAERAEISAEFDLAALPALVRWLEEQELAGDDGAFLIRRVIEPTGRSRAYINGRAATLAQLREAGEFLVDIHGQHEHQSLLRARDQRTLVDTFGGLAEQAAAVERAWREWQRRRTSRTAFETDAAAYAADRERLEWQLRDLETLGFAADEWAGVVAEHSRLAHAAALIEAAQQSLDTLSEGDGSALAHVNSVLARLNNLVEHDAGLRAIVDVLEPAQIQLQEAVYALRHYGDRIEVDPQRLREVEQRLDAVHSAARKYRVPPEELPVLLENARTRLAELGASGDAETLRRLEEEAHAACAAEAKKLSAGRRKAAAKLGEQVTQAMQTLAMAGGVFAVELTPGAEVTAHGAEDIEFRVAAHKSMAPLPLAKVASGGELSRLSLAIQTVTSQVAAVPTLIFDEVDAGIGGRVAEIVGNLLKQLGRKYQVMCITHLPQVAAAANHQWQVTKSQSNGKVSNRVTVLGKQERVEEIARMLGGIKITDTTRKHAAEMLGAKR
jgi:DNA repair protein RecN (Recombination protein N)